MLKKFKRGEQDSSAFKQTIDFQDDFIDRIKYELTLLFALDAKKRHSEEGAAEDLVLPYAESEK